MRIIRELALKTAGTILLVLYSTITLTAQFPAFHNHGPIALKTCHEHEASCDIPHNHAPSHTSEILCYLDYHTHESGLCMPCIWQALAKKHCTIIQSDNLIDDAIGIAIQQPETTGFISPAYSLSASRAPPTS